MSELDQIVSVTITADSRTPTRQGFGTPLLLSYHTRFGEQYQLYSSTKEMTTAGFLTTDSAYRMAAAVFSQNPAPKQVVVGRLPAAPAFTRTLTVTSAVEGKSTSFKIIAPIAGTVSAPAGAAVVSPQGAITAGTEVSVSLPYAVATHTDIDGYTAALEIIVDDIPGITSSAATNVITITAATSGDPVWVSAPVNCTIEETTVDAGYDTELTALQAVYDSWYFICIDTGSTANVADAAAWALANNKLLFATSDSAGLLAGTNALASDLKDAGNDAAVVLYSGFPHKFSAAAWVGYGAARTPGSVTWALKELKGALPDALSTSQRVALETDNVNHYQTLAGFSRTRPGKVASGEWIDVVHGIAALESRIKEDVWAVLATSDKVPYTTGGLEIIRNTVLGALKAFEGAGSATGLLVENSSVVAAPDIADVSSSDKANRQLTGVTFQATLEGAVHYVAIEGTLSV